MNSSYTVIGLSTGIIRPGDLFSERIATAAASACGGFAEGDILVLAETAVATAEGNVIRLDSVTPSPHAQDLAKKYQMDPRTTEVVLSESDDVVGGIPGFLLCMKQGTLLPNAGVDASNAPPGCIVPLPKDPEERKKVIFLRIFYDRDIQDQKEWIRREPKNQTSVPQHKEP